LDHGSHADNVAESAQRSAISIQAKQLAFSNWQWAKKQLRINTKHANHFNSFWIRVHSRDSRLILLDLQLSAESAAMLFCWVLIADR
jgi:hypothetical protein